MLLRSFVSCLALFSPTLHINFRRTNDQNCILSPDYDTIGSQRAAVLQYDPHLTQPHHTCQAGGGDNEFGFLDTGERLLAPAPRLPRRGANGKQTRGPLQPPADHRYPPLPRAPSPTSLLKSKGFIYSAGEGVSRERESVRMSPVQM